MRNVLKEAKNKIKVAKVSLNAKNTESLIKKNKISKGNLKRKGSKTKDKSSYIFVKICKGQAKRS